jgi:hypothetical protein
MSKKNRLNKKQKAYNERFVRWQQLEIRQMSFTNNLILGFNLGFLGFFVTQSGLKFGSICSILTITQVLTLIGLGISFVIGIILVVNRLKDFRATTHLIKLKKKRFKAKLNSHPSTSIKSINDSIQKLKIETEKLGKFTWALLDLQIWSFLVGTIFGIIYLISLQNT